MKNVLVTGGAGYIGSHACKVLRDQGYVPVTYDNLSTGWEDAVKFGPFERGDLHDRARLDEVFAKYQPVAVMHFAAFSQVGEAMREPGKYWHNNVGGSLVLIEAAVAARLAEGPPVDAIILPSAGMAMPAVSAAEAAGLGIGREIDLLAKETVPMLRRFRAPILTNFEDVSKAGAFLAQAAIHAATAPEAAPMQALDIPQA